MKRFNRDMLQGPLFGSILSYTVPIIFASLLQLLFNAADLVVVGRYRGSLSVGAVGATGAITNLIVTLFIGLSVGAGVSVAHAIGSKDHEMAHRLVHTTLPLAVIGGAVLTIIGVLFSEEFLRMMDTPADILPLSAVYMRIYFCGIIFSMVYNYCAAILRAAGDTRGPLLYLTVAGILNVILNLVFVVVFGMDVEGVSLATVISQGLSAVLAVRALMKRTDACKLQWRKMRLYKSAVAKILKLGLPAGVQGSMFSISNVMIQSSINAFGPVFTAGNAAAGNIEGFVIATMNAYHQTALNYTGQNAGAGQYKRVLQILWICLGCVAVTGIVVGGAAYLFAPWLLRIYIVDSQQAIADGVLRMAFVCLPYFLWGMQDVTTGVLRGLGASLISMLISVAGICVMRVVWIYTVFQIPKYHTTQGLFISYPISWVLTFVLQMLALVYVYRKFKAKCKQLME